MTMPGMSQSSRREFRPCLERNRTVGWHKFEMHGFNFRALAVELHELVRDQDVGHVRIVLDALHEPATIVAGSARRGARRCGTGGGASGGASGRCGGYRGRIKINGRDLNFFQCGV